MSKIQSYIDEMKDIQNKILELIDDDENIEENYQNLIKLIDNQKIKNDRNNFKAVLHLILKIASHHNRSLHFFDKIERILLYVKNQILQTFSNYEIFDIFKGNKRVLLFLFEEKILSMDNFICTTLLKQRYFRLNYPHYLYTEIKPFLTDEMNQMISKKIPENFEEKRKIGENDDYICELIRNDSIEEFITLMNRKDIWANSRIKPSIFETNSYLVKNDPILIEYTAFFGSIQIFRYLYKNEGVLVYTIWRYAIHGRNPEIIHILEENNVTPKLCMVDSYEGNFREAIKCHHDEMFDYFTNQDSIGSEDLTLYCLKYYNFSYLDAKNIDQYSIFDLCKFDYYHIIVELLKNITINLNMEVILMLNFLNYVFFSIVFF